MVEGVESPTSVMVAGGRRLLGTNAIEHRPKRLLLGEEGWPAGISAGRGAGIVVCLEDCLETSVVLRTRKREE